MSYYSSYVSFAKSLQSQIGFDQQSFINVPKNATETMPALLHLPSDYNTSGNKLYPMIVFFHGIGEGGNDLSIIYNHSMAGGPAYEIMNNNNDMTYVNPYTGVTEKFIVVTPQSNEPNATTKEQVPFILGYLYENYRVDAARVHLTGISQGGKPVCEYPGGLAGDPVFKMASIVPMSAALSGNEIEAMATKLKNDGVDVWGFGGKTSSGVWDTHGANTGTLVWWFTWELPPYRKVMTEYVSDPAHWGWQPKYDQSFKQWIPNSSRPGGGDMMCIYEWMLTKTATIIT